MPVSFLPHGSVPNACASRPEFFSLYLYSLPGGCAASPSSFVSPEFSSLCTQRRLLTPPSDQREIILVRIKYASSCNSTPNTGTPNIPIIQIISLKMVSFLTRAACLVSYEVDLYSEPWHHIILRCHVPRKSKPELCRTPVSGSHWKYMDADR